MIRMLPDGRRLHLQDGPIDLIIEANGSWGNVVAAYEAAAGRFVSILDELCSELGMLRTAVTQESLRPLGAVAQRMFDAVRPYSRDSFITPMAAVAGSVAEAVLDALLAAAPLERAYVNNGGDIAIHLGDEQSYTIGMVERPDRPSLFGSCEISADDPVRGIATSGWRGRSFSLGIADAVTVLAGTAAAADAAATVIANAVDLPGHAGVRRAPAREIVPDSDLRERLVTREVAPLCLQEIKAAFDSGALVAESLRSRGLIHAVAIHLQGHTRTIARDEGRSFEMSQRSLLHA